MVKRNTASRYPLSQADLRKEHLLSIHKIELEAAMEFSKNIEAVIDVMMNTPEMARSRARERVSAVGRRAEGGMSQTANVARREEAMKDALNRMTIGFKVLEDIPSLRAQEESAAAELFAKNAENMTKTLERSPELLKKALAVGLVQKIGGNIVAGGEGAEAGLKRLKERDVKLRERQDKETLDAGLVGMAASFRGLEGTRIYTDFP